MSVTFELKFYSNDISVVIYDIFICLTLVSFIFSSFIMNIPFLGRKHSINFFLFIAIILRIVKTIDNNNAIIFLFIRIAVYSVQLPLHTLITESFTTNERVTNYGYVYFAGKVAAIITPFILEYLSFRLFDYLMIFSAIIQIILILMIKETFDKSLID